MRTLCVDYGDKRIGVAVSDPLGIIAQGVETMRSSGDVGRDALQVADIARKLSVSEIVVGLPKTLKGEIGPKAQAVQKFTEALRAKVSFPVVEWDERFSTKAVERTLIEANVSRAKRKTVIDKSAAIYILQGYLDSKKLKEK